MKTKTLGAISGLAAMLGMAGCMDFKHEQFTCTADGNEVRVNYVLRDGEDMMIGKVEIYKNNTLFLEMSAPHTSDGNLKIVCDDGHVIQTSGYCFSDSIYMLGQKQ